MRRWLLFFNDAINREIIKSLRITYAARNVPLGKGFIAGVDGDKIFGMLDGTAVGIVEFHGAGIAQVVGGKGRAD